jgi:hypothetical protein
VAVAVLAEIWRFVKKKKKKKGEGMEKKIKKNCDIVAMQRHREFDGEWQWLVVVGTVGKRISVRFE